MTPQKMILLAIGFTLLVILPFFTGKSEIAISPDSIQSALDKSIPVHVNHHNGHVSIQEARLIARTGRPLGVMMTGTIDGWSAAGAWVGQATLDLTHKDGAVRVQSLTLNELDFKPTSKEVGGFTRQERIGSALMSSDRPGIVNTSLTSLEISQSNDYKGIREGVDIMSRYSLNASIVRPSLKNLGGLISMDVSDIKIHPDLVILTLKPAGFLGLLMTILKTLNILLITAGIVLITRGMRQKTKTYFGSTSEI